MPIRHGPRRLFTKRVCAIAQNTAVSGIARRPTTIRVVIGLVWITVEGRDEDHWLHAGEAVDVPGGRLVVCEAADAFAILDLGDWKPGWSSLIGMDFRTIESWQ